MISHVTWPTHVLLSVRESLPTWGAGVTAVFHWEVPLEPDSKEENLLAPGHSDEWQATFTVDCL